jgi:hypothetical protein
MVCVISSDRYIESNLLPVEVCSNAQKAGPLMLSPNIAVSWFALSRIRGLPRLELPRKPLSMAAVLLVVLAFLRKSQYLQTMPSAHSKYLPHYSQVLPNLLYTTQYKNIESFNLLNRSGNFTYYQV